MPILRGLTLKPDSILSTHVNSPLGSLAILSRAFYSCRPYIIQLVSIVIILVVVLVPVIECSLRLIMRALNLVIVPDIINNILAVFLKDSCRFQGTP